MYSRRRRSPILPRLLSGVAIIILVVVGFGLFERFGHANRQEVVATPTRVVVSDLPNATPKAPVRPANTLAPAEQMAVISEQASLSAPIRELYYGVNENWDVTLLGEFAGHLEGTRLIGQGGNYVLAGHVELKDGRPGPFAKLKNLKAGDSIIVRKGSANTTALLHYTVTQVTTVNPNDIDVIRNHGYEELTLITCDGWDEASRTYKARTVVHARPADQKASASVAIAPTQGK
jgi:LPXTG-site transpeptidase (sortase) family protein